MQQLIVWLYYNFFSFSIDSIKCQIYDEKIVESLNKKQFSELDNLIWKHSVDNYYDYIKLIDDVSNGMHVLPEQVEVFLFYFNAV